jgi:predicted ATPase
LVTSREALNLQEAWFHPVAGLSFPPDSQLMTEKQPEMRLERYDAVQLFVQSAQRATVQFSLAAEQAHVIRICQLVEGLPLALELAAAWLKVMPAKKIVEEIERGLDILTTRLRNIPERHRNIRAVFEHSWYLLTPEERNILKQLSVFHGSFDRDAAEAVAGASILNLATLVEKSLVRVTESGRYQIHELLRQFTAEKLAQSPEEREQLLDRHCRYFAGWLDRQDALLRTEQQLEAVRQISAELENIQAAWQWAVEQSDAAALRRFFWSLWFVYEAKSWFHAGVELFAGAAARLSHFEQAAPAPGSPEPRHVYAQLLAFHGRFQLRLHRLEQAKTWMQQCMPVLQQFKNQRDLGLALQTLGLIAWVQGHYLEARDYFEQSVRSAEQGGDLLVAAYSRSMTGFAVFGLGEYSLAEQLIRERLPLLRQLGKLWGLVFSLAYLSNILLILEKDAEAEQLLLEGLAISREMGDRWAVADCLRRLGALMTGGVKREEAKQLLLEGVAIFRDIDDHWGLTTTLNQLGQSCCALGEYEASWRYLSEGLQLAYQSSLLPIVLDILLNLADLLVQVKSFQLSKNNPQIEAVEILALVINHPASEQATKDRAIQLLAEREPELPADAIAMAIKRSRSRTLEATVAAILSR